MKTKGYRAPPHSLWLLIIWYKCATFHLFPHDCSCQSWSTIIYPSVGEQQLSPAPHATKSNRYLWVNLTYLKSIETYSSGPQKPNLLTLHYAPSVKWIFKIIRYNRVKNFKKFFTESCLELNTEYFGNGIFLHENTSNWNDCAELCQKESTCNYWTFKKPLTEQYGECELKRSDSGRSSNSGAVSGGRNCQGEDVIYLIGKVVDQTPNSVSISLRTYEHTAFLHTKSRATPKTLFLFIVNLPFFAAHIHEIIVRVYHWKCFD